MINLKLPIYGKKTLMLALEFGMLLSEIAKEHKIDLTPEMVAEAERIFISEIKLHGFDKTALNFTPLLLAILDKA